MADSFSELNLFAEFERTPEPADKILMSKCNADLKRDFTEHVSASDELLGLRVDEGEHGIEDSSVGSRLGVGTEIADGENPPTESEKRRQVTHRQSLRESSDKKSAADIAKLKAELCKLREDCEKLKRHSRLISTSKFGKLEEGPVIQVLYMNNHLSSKCRDMLETVLCRFIHENSHKNFINNQEKGIAPSSLCLDKDNDEVPIPEEKIRQIRTSTVIGCSQMYRQFIVDTMGWPLINNNPEASESWDRPNYKQVFKISLGDEVGEKENSCPQKLRRFSCFNCDGDHNMKDCKEPYNSAKVAQNKQKFRSETQSLQKQNSRYHVNDPKFSKFKAGCISEELRKAMGLADDQLPIYIYNMRRLGYPPGHFQALTDDSSGIAMFGNDGREISLSGEPVEEGEVEAAIPTSYCVDVTKIIEYPGYNVPLEGGVKDESKLLGKLEFSSRQSKEKMAEKVSEKNRGVKRRSNGDSMPKMKRKRGEEKPINMDISNMATTPDSPTDGDTLTLEELQQQKALIKQQLALAEGSDADIEVLDSYEEESIAPTLLPTPIQLPQQKDTPPATPQTSTSRHEHPNTTPLFKTPESSHHLRTPSTGGSLSLSLGTPVIDSGQSVPEAEKFSKGIQQEIPFENLPGATGTFERVKRVLSRLRSQKDNSS